MLLLACFRIIRVDALSEGLFKYIDDIKKCLIPNFLHLKHFRHLFRSPEQTCSAHPVSFLHSVYTIVIFFLFSKAIMKDGDALLKGPPAVVVAVCLCVVFMTTESLRAIKGDPVYKWPVTAESVQCQVRMLMMICLLTRQDNVDTQEALLFLNSWIGCTASGSGVLSSSWPSLFGFFNIFCLVFFLSASEWLNCSLWAH